MNVVLASTAPSDLEIAVAVVLWLGITLYAIFGGADFGSGFWDLTAGGARQGARARALVDLVLGSVWEANHVWLIFCLVVLWTAFSPAFAAIMIALYVPLILASFGIVLRGAGFAFRKSTTRFQARRAYGVVFAASSIITPFFMGLVAGAIASGRVHADNPSSSPDVWLGPSSLLGGVLAVATCAFLAATFLVHNAHHHDDHELARVFALRGMGAGVVCGVLAVVGAFVLHADAPYVFDRLTGVALPLMILSAAGGIGAIVALWKGRPVWARILAVGAVASVVWGWGLAQYPYLLPETMTIEQGASADSTLWVVLGVLGVAAVTVVPSLFLLYRLTEHKLLEGGEDLTGLAAENVPGSR